MVFAQFSERMIQHQISLKFKKVSNIRQGGASLFGTLSQIFLFLLIMMPPLRHLEKLMLLQQLWNGDSKESVTKFFWDHLASPGKTWLIATRFNRHYMSNITAGTLISVQ